MLNTRKITVDVTWDNIEKGQAKSCVVCPIALGILDALNIPYPQLYEDSFLHVNHTYVCIKGRNIDLPGEAIRFIRYFDRRLNVEPFSFDLEVPV